MPQFPIPSTTGPVSCWAVVPNTFANNFITAAAAAVGAGVNGRSGVSAGNTIGLAARTAAAVVTAALSATKVAVLLGWSERGPRIKVRRAWSRVFCDLTGPEIAFDKTWAGKEALIFMDLTKWNEQVYQSLAAMPRTGGFPGGSVPGDIGTFAMTEGAGVPMMFRFPHFDQHSVFKNGGMQAGYRFLCCTLEGDDDFETGSAPNKRHLAVHATQLHDPRSGSLLLYDFNVSSLPAVPVST